MTGPKHPATFSKELYPVLTDELKDCRRVLDPFAGVGNFMDLLHPLAAGVGVEIEPDWAAQCRHVECGDSRNLVDMFGLDLFDGVVSSPVYPNGMTDNFEAGVKSGRPWRRITYRQYLGHPLTEGSTAGCGRGLTRKFVESHTVIASQIERVMQPGARLVWNVKDVVVSGRVIGVVDWWWHTWCSLGLIQKAQYDIPCPGMRHGANRNARVETESIIVLEKPL